ncbi:uncharacterized protein VICG_00387 [Vittaforma corneae ATCC 50505]|uniref:Uncharacterized protein n=1 Tax=Vittaforma corneae (strain ATCC 50505) TaxID=993615 RepID=L2GQ78_VITCO|nr:uncharacterized protein VICG_00387 [Vittaforma corneae ATCC 50505]ELA42635.1 hypothetical protein VICG_00387 [Vittaforma corneae ATCC 50505]
MEENSERTGNKANNVKDECASTSHKFTRDEINAVLLESSSSLNKNIQSIIEDHSGNYCSISDIHNSTYKDVLSVIFDVIFDTPNYKKQVSLIDSILDSSPCFFHALLFHFTIEHFKGIPTDRKDKFYYLIKRTFNRVPLEYLLEIKDWDVAEYIWSMVENKNELEDWDDHRFIRYVISCKPFILKSIKIKLDRNIVRGCLDEPMSSQAREALYRLSE